MPSTTNHQNIVAITPHSLVFASLEALRSWTTLKSGDVRGRRLTVTWLCFAFCSGVQRPGAEASSRALRRSSGRHRHVIQRDTDIGAARAEALVEAGGIHVRVESWICSQSSLSGWTPLHQTTIQKKTAQMHIERGMMVPATKADFTVLEKCVHLSDIVDAEACLSIVAKFAIGASQAKIEQWLVGETLGDGKLTRLAEVSSVGMSAIALILFMIALS
jgi:hypothetical protein